MLANRDTVSPSLYMATSHTERHATPNLFYTVPSLLYAGCVGKKQWRASTNLHLIRTGQQHFIGLCWICVCLAEQLTMCTPMKMPVTIPQSSYTPRNENAGPFSFCVCMCVISRRPVLSRGVSSPRQFRPALNSQPDNCVNSVMSFFQEALDAVFQSLCWSSTADCIIPCKYMFSGSDSWV